jgi:hypothetical protein
MWSPSNRFLRYSSKTEFWRWFPISSYTLVVLHLMSLLLLSSLLSSLWVMRPLLL